MKIKTIFFPLIVLALLCVAVMTHCGKDGTVNNEAESPGKNATEAKPSGSGALSEFEKEMKKKEELGKKLDSVIEEEEAAGK